MSKRLEDLIRNNREEFDDLEPSAGLWRKIAEQLPAEEVLKKNEAKTFSLRFVLKMAASIIIVMGIGFFAYLRLQRTQSVDYAAINPAYAKQQTQYVSMVASKRSELRTLSQNAPEIYQEFSKEIAAMDSTYKRLNAELPASPNQEAVLLAMIRNLQAQTEVLNQQLNIIVHYNQMKKDEKNETQGI